MDYLEQAKKNLHYSQEIRKIFDEAEEELGSFAFWCLVHDFRTLYLKDKDAEYFKKVAKEFEK